MDGYDEERARHDFFVKPAGSKKVMNTQPKNSDAARLMVRIHQIETSQSQDQYKPLPKWLEKLEKYVIHYFKKVRCFKKIGLDLEFKRLVRQYVIAVIQPRSHVPKTVKPFYELHDFKSKLNVDSDSYDEEKGYEPEVDRSQVYMV